MPLFCLGLSHRTAPVEVREKFALAEQSIPAALTQLRASSRVDEAVWLSTCNRVELYISSDDRQVEFAHRFLLESGRSTRDDLGESLYLLREPESIEHLFRVACGLDSMVIGETEILGQLKRAYEVARRHGHTSARLNRAFQRAFNVAKQVRSETQIQRGGTSVASVAVELVEHVFETVEGRRVLVVGAGDTGEKVVRALLSRGASEVLIANRSPERAVALAAELGSRASAIQEWTSAAAEVDVFVSSTSSSGFVLDAARTARLMTERGQRPLLLIDLAVPRDIDPAVISISDVYLFNVDDLQAIADAHVRHREAEVSRCEQMIRQKAVSLTETAGQSRASMAKPLSAPA